MKKFISLILVLIFCTVAWGQVTVTPATKTWNNLTLKPEITVGDHGYATFAAAITAIASTSATLVLPSGNHVAGGVTVPVNVQLRPVKGAILTIATDTTLTINGTLDAGLYQIFSCTGTGTVAGLKESNPIWFGADNTGSADSTAAFNLASIAKRIYITEGTYKVTQWIVTTDNAYIYGPTAKIKLGTPGAVSYDTTAVALRITGDNVVVDGLEIDGYTATSWPQPGYPIQAYGDNITIKNCYIHDGCAAIAISPDTDITGLIIKNNRIHNFYYTAIELVRIGSASPVEINAEIYGNTITDCYVGVNFRHISNVLIKENYFKGLTGNCLNQAETGEIVSNISITNNKFIYDSTQPRTVGPATAAADFMEFQMVDGLIVRGNIITATRRQNTAIYVSGGAGSVAGHNKNVSITDNKIVLSADLASSGGYGINVQFTDGFVISSNIITYNSTDAPFYNRGGISAITSINGIINSNMINGKNEAYPTDLTKRFYYGISLISGCINVSIYNNSILNITARPIYCTVDLLHNFIYDNSFGTNVGAYILDSVVASYVNTWSKMVNGRKWVCLYTNIPATGNWIKGDRSYNRDPDTLEATYYVCTVSGTAGTLSGVTGDATATEYTLVVNDATNITAGNYLTIAGAGAAGIPLPVIVVSVSGTTITLDRAIVTTVTGAAVTYTAPTFKTGGLIG